MHGHKSYERENEQYYNKKNEGSPSLEDLIKQLQPIHDEYISLSIEDALKQYELTSLSLQESLKKLNKTVCESEIKMNKLCETLNKQEDQNAPKDIAHNEFEFQNSVSNLTFDNT